MAIEDDTTLIREISADLRSGAWSPNRLPQLVETDTKPNPVVLGAGDELMPDEVPEPQLDDTRPVEVENLLAEIPPPESPSPQPEAESIMAEQPAQEPIIAEQPAPESISDLESSADAVTVEPPDDSSQLSVFRNLWLAEAKRNESGGRRRRPAPHRARLSDRTSANARRLTRGYTGLAENREAQKGSTPADVPCASGAPISGWRRNARAETSRGSEHIPSCKNANLKTLIAGNQLRRKSKAPALGGRRVNSKSWVDEGARTLNRLNHNQVLCH